MTTRNAIAVDGAGNAYVAGVSDITGLSPLPPHRETGYGTPTTSTERSFVAKLNASGELVFSTLLGGSTNSYAQAVAVNAAGQVLVSGTSVCIGVSLDGRCLQRVSNTAFSPYLLELDPTGTKLYLLFSHRHRRQRDHLLTHPATFM